MEDPQLAKSGTVSGWAISLYSDDAVLPALTVRGPCTREHGGPRVAEADSD